MIIYAAIFAKEEDGSYFVRFPDLDGCLTEGKDLKQAVQMAEEALGGYVASLHERGLEIPAPSEIESIKTNKDEMVVMIYSNTDKYFAQSKAVKKTLTIPAWLNELADKQHINYSAVLQEALKKQLEI